MEKLSDIPYLLIYVVISLVYLLIGKLIYDLLTSYKLDKELTNQDNPAIGISLAGYFIGLIIILAGIVPEVKELINNIKVGDYHYLIEFGLFGFLGIILLNLSRILTDKLILYKFQINKELVDDRNVGTGVVLAGSYIASGLVILACLSGDSTAVTAFNNSFSPLVSGLLLSAIFYFIGQITFVVFSFIYSWLSPYNIHEEIEKDNVAAGVSFGGGLLALGLILYRGIHGDGSFTSWTDSLTYYGWLVIFAIIIFPFIRRYIVDKIMLPGVSLAEEITTDKNVNAAYLEIICLNVVSAVIIFAY